MTCCSSTTKFHKVSGMLVQFLMAVHRLEYMADEVWLHSGITLNLVMSNYLCWCVCLPCCKAWCSFRRTTQDSCASARSAKSAWRMCCSQGWCTSTQSAMLWRISPSCTVRQIARSQSQSLSRYVDMSVILASLFEAAYACQLATNLPAWSVLQKPVTQPIMHAIEH